MDKQTKVDRITNLPWDVLDTILLHLPLRETARTSILSSKWRYKWTCLPQFVLDDKCFRRTSLSDPGATWRQIMKILDHIRSNHSGSIDKFKLASYCCPDHSDLDQWIRFLTEKDIKELIIMEFKFIKHFKLPSCLFTCTQLSHLQLYGCFLKLPHSFKGLNSLRSLHLCEVSISDCTLENLIFNCPVLERLTLLNIDHLSFLRIQNPSLSYLKVDSQFEDICLENCPSLSSVDICMIPLSGKVTTWNLGPVQMSNLARVFGCLSSIKRLALSSVFLEFLGSNNVPERLPAMLKNLLVLELKELTFNSVNEIMVSLSVLGSSPNLEELVISVGQSNESMPAVELLRKQSVTDIRLNQLKIVRIRGIRGTRPEWEFVKFILASSPVLETMIVVRYGGERVPESVFLQAEHASQSLKIVKEWSKFVDFAVKCS